MAEDRTGVVARLDALEAAHKGATPGKWKVEPNGEISDGEYALVIGRGPVDCMAYCYGGTSTFEGENLPADAAAIVAEHNAVIPLVTAARIALDVRSALHAWGDDLTEMQVRELRRALDRVAAALGEA